MDPVTCAPKGGTHVWTEVKGKYPFGSENLIFSPREKPLDNTTDFFAFCLSRIINVSMSAYFAAPVTHQDLGRRISPTFLRRPDNIRSQAMSKVLLQTSRHEPASCRFSYRVVFSIFPPLIDNSAPGMMRRILACKERP